MTEKKIRCPCCDKQIILNISDTGEIIGVFFDGEKLSEEKAFEEYGICLGMKGGEDIE